MVYALLKKQNKKKTPWILTCGKKICGKEGFQRHKSKLCYKIYCAVLLNFMKPLNKLFP